MHDAILVVDLAAVAAVSMLLKLLWPNRESDDAVGGLPQVCRRLKRNALVARLPNSSR